MRIWSLIALLLAIVFVVHADAASNSRLRADGDAEDGDADAPPSSVSGKGSGKGSGETATPVVMRISPSVGSPDGDTQVMVEGRNMGTGVSDKIECVFGDGNRVTGSRLSEKRVACLSPKHDTGAVRVFVAVNGVESQTSAAFNFKEEDISAYKLRILRMLPTEGPLEGDTEVSVVYRQADASELRKSRPSDSFQCRFGEVTTSAYRSRPGNLVCMTPKGLELGSVPVSIRVNDGDFSEPTTFKYVASDEETPDLFYAMESILPSDGPMEGGSQVTMKTQPDVSLGDSARTQIRVRFGEDGPVVKAVRRSHHELRVVTPKMEADGPVAVFVSIDNDEFMPTGTSFTFTRDDSDAAEAKDGEAAFVSNVLPAGGSVVGGTQVRINGMGFGTTKTSFFKCVFGSVVVPARRVSDRVVTCSSPAMSATGPVALSLTMNDVAVNGRDLTFTYDAGDAEADMYVVEINSLSPTSGSMRGGTQVNIRGNFAGKSPRMFFKCRFGSTVVRAIRLAQDSIMCTSPPALPGTKPGDEVQVSVKENGSDWSTPLKFQYTAIEQTGAAAQPIAIESIAPLEGPMSGGTQVIVKGTGFGVQPSVFRCIFGSVSVIAIRLSPEFVKCSAPPAAATGPVKLIVEDTRRMARTNPVDFVVIDNDQFVDLMHSHMEHLTVNGPNDKDVHVVWKVIALLSLFLLFTTCLCICARKSSSAAGYERVGSRLQGRDLVE